MVEVKIEPRRRKKLLLFVTATFAEAAQHAEEMNLSVSEWVHFRERAMLFGLSGDYVTALVFSSAAQLPEYHNLMGTLKHRGIDVEQMR
jgi:hypothetical protein